MIKKIWIPALVGYFLLLAVLVYGLKFHWIAQDLSPEQPIDFSHMIHAGKLDLDCTHCHVNVGVSREAGAPALSICMECHESALTDRPEIRKLTGYWDAGEPVLWEKVHNLPWHARFTHERHIKAGVDCSVCHGQVEAMERVRRVRSLEMGWCVECHRSKGASDDCLTCHK